MVDQNLNKAESYYTMHNKNLDYMISYVHPNVDFIGPPLTMMVENQ
ncbi:hypothetical protein WBP_0849 [Wolbachia endosymbiont of Brugia pahangi]|nr:hypothetical protein WBP_0849 [Wolbachia endosymbiont of Brugia pahangi]